MNDTAQAYDQYWADRQGRTGLKRRRRSRARAGLALSLLNGKKGRLLDVGCGPGYGSRYFMDNGYEVLGVEVSGAAASQAEAAGVAVVTQDIEKAPLPEGLFDGVVALEVLEHVAQPLALLKAMAGRLAPDGALIISLPNEFHLIHRLMILLGWAPFGGHDDPHRWHFGIAAIHRFIHAAGMRCIAHRTDPVVPPGWFLLRPASALLARLFPGLFALSVVLRLAPLENPSVQAGGQCDSP